MGPCSKKAGALLAAVCAVCTVLAGCTNGVAPSAEEVSAALTKPLTVRAELCCGGGSAAGVLDFSPAGARFEAEAPEELAGLVIALSAEGETLAFCGMEKRLPPDSLPGRNPVKLINSALAAAAAGTAYAALEDGEVLISGRTEAGAFVLKLEPGTLAPKAL